MSEADLEKDGALSSVQLEITQEGFLQADPPLRFWLKGLDPNSQRSGRLLLLIILLPLTALSASAWFEKGFLPESVRCLPMPEKNLLSVDGMSYLGDATVWPFVFLIPLAFRFLAVAARKLEDLFDDNRSFVSHEWLENYPGRNQDIVARVHRTLRGEGFWRALQIGAIIVGLILVVWNAVMCSLPSAQPYKAKYSYIQQHRHAVKSTTLVCSLALQEIYSKASDEDEVPVPKWNTDREHRQLSWLTTQVWAVFLGYTWIPLIVFKIANLAIALRLYINEIAKSPGALRIQPLALDGAGGLSVLSEVSWALLLPLLCVGIMASLSLFREHAESNKLVLMPTAITGVFIGVYMLTCIMVFITPLIPVHAPMMKLKKNELREISDRFDHRAEFLRRALLDAKIELPDVERWRSEMRVLHETYNEVSRMPTWPFQVTRLTAIMGAVPLSVLPTLFQVLKSIWTKYRR
jgi:hypothetical protein